MKAFGNQIGFAVHTIQALRAQARADDDHAQARRIQNPTRPLPGKESTCTHTSSPCSCSYSGSCGCSQSSEIPSPGTDAPDAEPRLRTPAPARPVIPGGPNLDAKLDVFDAHAWDARWFILTWLTRHGDDLVALARGRHVEGHYRYGDRNFLEWDEDELVAQAAQELADALVYLSRVVHLRKSS